MVEICSRGNPTQSPSRSSLEISGLVRGFLPLDGGSIDRILFTTSRRAPRGNDTTIKVGVAMKACKVCNRPSSLSTPACIPLQLGKSSGSVSSFDTVAAYDAGSVAVLDLVIDGSQSSGTALKTWSAVQCAASITCCSDLVHSSPAAFFGAQTFNNTSRRREL